MSGVITSFTWPIRRPTTFQAQVICLDCDKIFEIDAPFMEWYGKTVADKLALEVETQRLQVSAHCTELTGGWHLRARRQDSASACSWHVEAREF